MWTVFSGTSVFAASAPEPAPPAGCDTVAHHAAAAPAGKVLEPAFPPIPLQVRTPVEPVVFSSGGRNYLVYELHLQNFGHLPLTVRGIEVIHMEKPIAKYMEAQLSARLHPVGIDDEQYKNPRTGDAHHRINGGQSAVAFLCLALDGDAPVPEQLQHRVLLDDAVADGPLMEIQRSTLPVFGRPLLGSDWVAGNAPGLHSHHRMGLMVAGGLAQLSRRYAIDWRKSKQGALFSGDPRDVRSYHTYGETVLAVADGTVVQARDGMPDNIPRTAAGFDTAVPITMESLGGNSVVIELENGQFASYSHLQPGSVRVNTGERVRRGQRLGKIGNSGDSRWPHLHFQVTSTPHILDSEGVPFVIDQFRIKSADQPWQTRTEEFPMGHSGIDFGPASKATPK